MRFSKHFTLSSILLGRATSFTPKFTQVITTIARNNISSTSASKLLASLEGQDAIDSKGSAVSFKVTYVSEIQENFILIIIEINLIFLLYFFSATSHMKYIKVPKLRWRGARAWHSHGMRSWNFPPVWNHTQLYQWISNQGDDWSTNWENKCKNLGRSSKELI